VPQGRARCQRLLPGRHNFVASRRRDVRYGRSGVELYDEKGDAKPTLVLYDAALPLREWGVIQRDAITKAQQATIELRQKKWGTQAAPEAVRLKRLAKLGRRFKGCRELTDASDFFRDYVYLADPTPRSDAAANAAYWDALAAAGASFVIFPEVGAKRWPEPKWGVVAAYEKRHGARAKILHAVPTGGAPGFAATAAKKFMSWVLGSPLIDARRSCGERGSICACWRRGDSVSVGVIRPSCCSVGGHARLPGG